MWRQKSSLTPLAPLTPRWPVNWLTVFGSVVLIAGAAQIAIWFGVPWIIGSTETSTDGMLVGSMLLWTLFWILLTLVRAVARQFQVSKPLRLTVVILPLVAGASASAVSIVTDLDVILRWDVKDRLLVFRQLGTLSPLLMGLTSAGTLFTLDLLVARMAPSITTGLCSKCGYNLTGNVSGTCPECGEAVGTPS